MFAPQLPSEKCDSTRHLPQKIFCRYNHPPHPPNLFASQLRCTSFIASVLFRFLTDTQPWPILYLRSTASSGLTVAALPQATSVAAATRAHAVPSRVLKSKPLWKSIVTSPTATAASTASAERTVLGKSLTLAKLTLSNPPSRCLSLTLLFPRTLFSCISLCSGGSTQKTPAQWIEFVKNSRGSATSCECLKSNTTCACTADCTCEGKCC